ncbi:unnamed protein product [Protopolystoma xenopodis]|uniref:Uncharacterized protein n=1 Tax=Protopolystoma xenopodis TaxID=117903 RepID=A0A3S5C478_9PLAT|nr:unnamed protein product [Protopolystoma xenopodis]
MGSPATGGTAEVVGIRAGHALFDSAQAPSDPFQSGSRGLALFQFLRRRPASQPNHHFIHGKACSLSSMKSCCLWQLLMATFQGVDWSSFCPDHQTTGEARASYFSPAVYLQCVIGFEL